jgi:hypothetical protein
MGRIQEAGLQSLIELWSPVVKAALEQMGNQRWPPLQQKQGLLKRPKPIPRFMVEGPVLRGGEVQWAASHTISPSAFDIRGNLSEGQREYWIVALVAGEPPHIRVEGAQTLEDIPAENKAFQAALAEALAAGPRHDTFYGNRGPLSHRSGK